MRGVQFDGCSHANTVRGSIWLTGVSGQQNFEKMSIHSNLGPGIFTETDIRVDDSIFYQTKKHAFYAEKGVKKVIANRNVFASNEKRDASSYGLSLELTAAFSAFFTDEYTIKDNLVTHSGHDGYAMALIPCGK